MLNQFSRTELLLGHDNMEKLKNARVAVFGIGGVGGFTVEALARSGVGTLDLIDDDRVCLTNINRQIIATRKTIGQYKVDAAKERILDINPDAVVNTYKTFFMPDTADAFPRCRFCISPPVHSLTPLWSLTNTLAYSRIFPIELHDGSLYMLAGYIEFCHTPVLQKSNNHTSHKKFC